MLYLDEKSHATSQLPASPRFASTITHALGYIPRGLAFLVLVIYAPVIVAAGLLVTLTSPGPAFVKKAYRRGNGSEEIVYLYELRTECWQTWQRTSLGDLLYQADLHRLPRLVNVLQGQVKVGERVERIRNPF